MSKSLFRVCLVFAVGAAACTKSAPTQPSVDSAAAPAANLTASIVAPRPLSPANNAQTASRPTLRVANATRTGPAGAITYRFEISTSSAFATTVASAAVSEGINETGYTPPLDLTLNTLYFWRATAIDASNGIGSAPS